MVQVSRGSGGSGLFFEKLKILIIIAIYFYQSSTLFVYTIPCIY